MPRKSKPCRIQLRRTKGFNLQAASLRLNGLPAVAVTRPGHWGNPYKVSRNYPACAAVADFRRELRYELMAMETGDQPRSAHMRWIAQHIQELRGKNVACFCEIGDACHGDILIEVANA